SSLSTCLRLSYKAQGKPFFRSFIPKHSAVQQNKLNQSFTPIPIMDTKLVEKNKYLFGGCSR
ncbi:MAG: hypothetical protein ABSB71_11240, partial [Candidatus Bathyarchaeia archaeon]